MTKKIRTYSTEFKAEAVKKIADNNRNVSATAEQLGIAHEDLYLIGTIKPIKANLQEQLGITLNS